MDAFDILNEGTIPSSQGRANPTDMHAYLATVFRSHDCETLIVGGEKDHVHALFTLSRKYSIC